MELHRFESASQFYDRAETYLLANEALHNLMLGVSKALVRHPERYPLRPYLAIVEEQGEVVAVAMRTSPYKLLVSQVWDEGGIDALTQNSIRKPNSQSKIALEAIARDFYTRGQDLPGVSAPAAEAEAFARIWQKMTGQSYQLSLQLYVHQLEKVQPVVKARGELRLASGKERELAIAWQDAFFREAMDLEKPDLDWTVEYQLEENRIYFWVVPTADETGEVPVALVVCGRCTPNGATLSAVYTPPEYRRKGYATSCVAALSQLLLDRGHRYCFLFTDVTNPTSNHIYSEIGYQPVGDWNEYVFD
jgi:uncharacterized protein